MEPKIVRKKITKKELAKIVKENFLGLFTYKLQFKDGDVLKVDFNYYPFPQISKGKLLGNLKIDSLNDIAANKIHNRRAEKSDFLFDSKPSRYL